MSVIPLRVFVSSRMGAVYPGIRCVSSFPFEASGIVAFFAVTLLVGSLWSLLVLSSSSDADCFDLSSSWSIFEYTESNAKRFRNTMQMLSFLGRVRCLGLRSVWGE